jgi:branched-chain amino acid transport system substrate-binding protein
MSNRKIYVFLATVLVLVLIPALFITGCAEEAEPAPATPAPAEPAPTPEVKHITVGSVMGLTGPLAVPCLAFTRGWEFYADKMEEQGGIKIGNDRYVFDFIYEDSKGTAEGASVATNKLVTQDKAKFIFGGMLESEMAAIYQITQPNNVLYVMANINIPGHEVDVSPDKPLQVRPMVDHTDTHAPDLNYLLENYPGDHTIAVSAPDIGYEGMVELLKKDAEARGMEVIFVEKWAWGTTDFVPTFTRLLNSKPDVVFAMCSGQADAQLIAARQLGFEGPFISNCPLGADVFINVVKDPVWLTDVLANSPNVDELNPAMADLKSRWEAKYPDDPFISDCIHANDMPWIIAQAMEKAQSVDPAVVMATLEGMTNQGDVITNFGPGRMGGMDRYGVNRILLRPIPITVIMNGEAEFVGFFSPEEK